ncbi:hypothetical protein CTI12_AA320170 [Artemisia annua]|uniref:NAC domain-containing protein n=1 Tax=Artemisia annua TaxID=35608 RepID=A0A2U1MYA8_ARTAN|nr:hypothetical protein CTI12_AA320170 [Artemisia annua]
MGDREIDFDCGDIESLPTNDPVPIPRMSDEPLGNSDSISRSFDVTISNPLFDFDDNFALRIDNKFFDDEFEDLCSLDPSKSTPLIDDESTLLVTPLPVSKQICLREVERFDPFFSLTQSGDVTWVMDKPFRFTHTPLPRQVAYSPKVVLYRFFHPSLTLSDGRDHDLRRYPLIGKTFMIVAVAFRHHSFSLRSICTFISGGSSVLIIYVLCFSLKHAFFYD